MQRWEYKVVVLRDRHYTAALNDFGREGWELVSVISEAVAAAATSPERSGAFPLPGALGRLEGAADKLTKFGASDQADEQPAGATPRLLWVFRRPLGDD